MPSSSLAARTLRSVSSPVSGSSVSTAPTPTARMARPPDSWSSVATWLATFQGRRNGSGVRMVPSLTRLVRAAIAASSVHGSTP
jgi:hypothetical protein